VDNFSKQGKIFYISQCTNPGNVENKKEVNEEKENYKVIIFKLTIYDYS